MIYRKSGRSVKRKVAGEVVLVPIRGNLADMQRLFVLDGTADFIWEMLDGANSVADIREALASAYRVSPAQAETDAVGFISDLEAAGLIAQT